MDQDEKKAPETPAEVDDLNVNPISDEDLETVAGGTAGNCTGCWVTFCCTTFSGKAEDEGADGEVAQTRDA
jgi:hypothetical protein